MLIIALYFDVIKDCWIDALFNRHILVNKKREEIEDRKREGKQRD
jgi:hypothetical protein